MLKITLGVFGVLTAGVVLVLVLGGIPKGKGTGGLSKIQTVSFQEHGIEIIGPNEAGFSTLMSEQLQKTRGVDVAALKSSSVFVLNKSGKSIAALSVVWELLLADGRTVSHGSGHKSGLVVVSDGNSPQLMADIAPNGSRLFSLLDLPSDPTGRSGSRTGGGGGMDRARQFAESVKVTISVDSVLFADGTFSGPDTNSFFGALKAEIDARRDVIEEMAKVLNGDEEALKRVELMANGRLNGTTRASGGNGSYYDGLKQTQASIMMKTRKKFGDKALLDALETELSNPRINLRKLQTN